MANKKQTVDTAAKNGPKRVSVKLPNVSKKTITIVLVAIVVLVIALLSVKYVQTRNELNKARDPQSAAQADAENIVKEVGKYMDLPLNEKPTTATVTDKEKLQEQPIFKRAENGDKVLIYSEAQRAMVYRPSSKKVIEYAPVNLAAGEQKAGTQQ